MGWSGLQAGITHDDLMNISKAHTETPWELIGDIVNIFRQPGQVGPIVDIAIRIGARCIWMQEGVEDHDAASRAEAAGLSVMENRCILKYHRRLMS